MSQKTFITFAGWAGIATFVLFVFGLAFQFAAGPPPEFGDTVKLTRHIHDHATLIVAAGLVITLALMIELALVVGIRELLRQAGASWVPAANLFLLFYVVAYPLGLVASGLLIAATTESVTGGDASAVRALWGGGLSLLGAVSFLPLILATVIYAIAVLRTGVLPRWTAWIAWMAALGGVAAVPAAFNGGGFYSQVGAAPSLLQGVPGLVWVLVVSITMIRRPASR
jgi:hypothetical protein